MIKDVLINIKGVQGIDDQTDTIEFSTEGRFGLKNGEFYISYDEGQMFENGGSVKTQIFIKPDNSVVLNRTGDLCSKMLIEKGKRNTCFYRTFQGDLVIGIFGEKIEHSLDETGGQLNLSYTIDSDLRLISRNTVNIFIRGVR